MFPGPGSRQLLVSPCRAQGPLAPEQAQVPAARQPLSANRLDHRVGWLGRLVQQLPGLVLVERLGFSQPRVSSVV